MPVVEWNKENLGRALPGRGFYRRMRSKPNHKSAGYCLSISAQMHPSKQGGSAVNVPRDSGVAFGDSATLPLPGRQCASGTVYRSPPDHQNAVPGIAAG